jgi:hypothetical protein
MKNKIILTVLLLCSLLANLSYAGGAWTQKKGEGYFKVSQWWLTFDQHFTSSGQLDPNVTTGVYNTFLYTEYGITDRFTGLFNGALFSRNYSNNLVSNTTGRTIVAGDAVNSIGDIDVGIKYSFTKPGAKFPIAGSLILGIPTGTSVAGEQKNLQTGDGEFNQIIQIDGATGFKVTEKISGYVNLYTGFNNRTNNFSEEFRYGGELGFGFLKSKLWLAGKITGIESLKNGATAEDNMNATGIFANNAEFTSYSVEVNYYVLKRWGISANFASAFRGEIIAAAPAYSVGIFLDTSR